MSLSDVRFEIGRSTVSKSSSSLRAFLKESSVSLRAATPSITSSLRAFLRPLKKSPESCMPSGLARTIISKTAEINVINVSRGIDGLCNDGDGGKVIINTTSPLTIDSISALDNSTIDNPGGNITLVGYNLLVTNLLYT